MRILLDTSYLYDLMMAPGKFSEAERKFFEEQRLSEIPCAACSRAASSCVRRRDCQPPQASSNLIRRISCSTWQSGHRAPPRRPANRPYRFSPSPPHRRKPSPSTKMDQLHLNAGLSTGSIADDEQVPVDCEVKIPQEIHAQKYVGAVRPQIENGYVHCLITTGGRENRHLILLHYPLTDG